MAYIPPPIIVLFHFFMSYIIYIFLFLDNHFFQREHPYPHLEKDSFSHSQTFTLTFSMTQITICHYCIYFCFYYLPY